MNTTARMLLVLLVTGLLGLNGMAQQQTDTAAQPVKTESDEVGLLKKVLDRQANLENKLFEIQKQLDSISKFLGDQQPSSFDTVDRRLRDIADDVKDIRR